MRISFDDINGLKFKVKPKNLLANKVRKELAKMLTDWQEENNKEFVEFAKKYRKELSDSDYEALKEVDIPEGKDWVEDVDFRSEYYKKMADACIEFDKEPNAKFWKSDELEVGKIELAFDFFTGERQIPMNAI